MKRKFTFQSNQSFLLVIVLLFFCSCYSSPPKSKVLMREDFWSKGENQDLPQFFEAVNIDFNGKETGKGGSTHFDTEFGEINVDYSILDNSIKALNLLNANAKNSHKIIRKGAIKDSNGNQVGEKVLVVKDWRIIGGDYALMWTRNSRFTEISSDALSAIEAYENDRNL